MPLTAAICLIGLAALLRELRNGFYAAHVLIVAGGAWVWEQQAGKAAIFSEPALQTTLILHLISITLITFACYGWDKHAAQTRQWRVPERVLHAFALIGGTLGAYAGQKTFRHKTKKHNFRVMFWIIFIVQLIGLAVLLKNG